MKNRFIPFGYIMEKGIICIHESEADAVKLIYSEYLNGLSLKKISERLSDDNIEYFPGISSWNKNRVKRILEDVRYIGDDKYKRIITSEIYDKANNIKKQKYTCNRCPSPSKTEYKPVYAIAYCADCGSQMLRRINTRNKKPEVWTCQNPDCHHIVKITTDNLLADITKILNTLITDTTKIIDNSVSQSDTPLEVKRIENDIERLLNSTEVDKDEIKNLILRCAAKKYESIKNARHITTKLKADFEKSSPLSNFSIEIFNKTVSEIQISEDGEIKIKLVNGQIVGKE